MNNYITLRIQYLVTTLEIMCAIGDVRNAYIYHIQHRTYVMFGNWPLIYDAF